MVVICFQSIIFDILKTTHAQVYTCCQLLWFAFNLLSLTYWKQLQSTEYTLICVVICFQSIIFDILKTTSASVKLNASSCDLLSIYYLWHTENNKHRSITKQESVVICFQSIIFDILKTTCAEWGRSSNLLWFAFNLLSLTYWKQPNYNLMLFDSVVICFQSIIFDILKTTIPFGSKVSIELWFAFNLLSLTYWKQLREYLHGL